MKKILTALFLVLIFALPVFAEDTVKDFTLKTIDGKTLTSSSLRGAPFVVNVAGTWWKKCKKEIPEFQKASLVYKDRGVRIIAVFVKSELDDIKEFVDTNKITFPVGKDNGLAKDLGAQGVPVTIFIDKNGKIVKRHFSIIDYEQLSSNIEAMLK
jgi:cytochrome c biogenesis protein CcmG/thiol:disulfide interchange protein DsbE